MSATLENAAASSHVSLFMTDGVAFLHLRGEMDIATADHVRALGEDAINDLVGTIRINLADVTFIDSTCLSALVRIRNAAEAAGRSLIIDQPSARVQKLFDITGLTDAFTLSLSGP
jgi:anti-sigma B factor antagonist